MGDIVDSLLNGSTDMVPIRCMADTFGFGGRKYFIFLRDYKDFYSFLVVLTFQTCAHGPIVIGAYKFQSMAI